MLTPSLSVNLLTFQVWYGFYFLCSQEYFWLMKKCILVNFITVS